MENEKKYTYPVIICFALFIAVIMAAAVFTPAKEYSEKEQKSLAQNPFLLKTGSWDDFTKAADSFLSDQFPWRDAVIDGYTEIQMAQDKEVIYDVYVLDSDYLFEYTYPTKDVMADELCSAVLKSKKSAGIPFIFAVTPDKNLALAEGEETLDDATNKANLERITSKLSDNKIQCINCAEYIMSFSIEDRARLFYKTDFHWNDDGGFIASSYIAQSLADMGFISESEIPLLIDFIHEDYSERSYLGDLQKRFSNEVTVKEYVPYYEPLDVSDFVYYDSLNGTPVDRGDIIGTGIANSESVLEYSTVCMSNMPYLRIENPNAKSNKKVLILKDSYQCCMTDYLSELFSEINIVDPRFTCPELGDIISDRDVDMVLMIYHCSNISQDLINYLS